MSHGCRESEKHYRESWEIWGVDQEVLLVLGLAKVLVEFIVLVACSLCVRKFWCHLWSS